MSAANESQICLFGLNPINPATDTLQHKSFPIYGNRITRSKRCLIYATELYEGSEFGRFVKFLLTLINNKWPPGTDPGGHHFVVLNVSINNKPFFFSAVVIYRKAPDPKIEGFRIL